MTKSQSLQMHRHMSAEDQRQSGLTDWERVLGNSREYKHWKNLLETQATRSQNKSALRNIPSAVIFAALALIIGLGQYLLRKRR